MLCRDLKNALEQQFAGCRGQTQQRILIPSQGLKYTWDAGRACDARISDVQLLNTNGAVVDQIVDANGVVLQAGKTYRVTVNKFLSTGGDGFTSFLAGAATLGGAPDIDALTADSGRLQAASASGLRPRRTGFAEAAHHPPAVTPRRRATCWALATAWMAAGPCTSLALARDEPAGVEAGRADRLAEAEAALARGDAALAMERFERAAAREHALDIELGLVRSLMQTGDYRRALSFASHSAGAHGDEPNGAAAYAWLLHPGAQPAIAMRARTFARARPSTISAPI